MFRLLNRQRAPRCHQLHFLQMATEKLAKAFLSGSGTPGRRPANVHTAFTGSVRMAKQRADIRKICGFPEDRRASYNSYIDMLIPTAREIERLAPGVGGADSPNTEYPWLHAGQVTSPLFYGFFSVGCGSSGFPKLLAFFEACLSLIRTPWSRPHLCP